MYWSSCQSALTTFGSTGTGGGGGGVPTGGGTGTGGGTATGGGGGTTTCTTLPSLTGQRTGARYTNGTNYEYTVAEGASSAGDPADLLSMEVIWTNQGTPTNVAVGTRNLATEGSYFACSFCATLRRSCTGGTSCTGGVYLARSGSMTVSSAPRTTTGTFSGSLSTVRFEEWNLGTDMPVTGGRCYIVPSGSISAAVMP